MRILLLIKSFDFGGAENHVLDLANSLDESDNDVFVAGGKGFQVGRLNPGVSFIPKRISDFMFPFQVIGICFLISKQKIDVIHAHKRLAILIASISGRIMNIPVIATVHGRPRHDLRSILSRRFTDKIIFVSKRTLDANKEIRSISGKTIFIPNGVSSFENEIERDYYSVSYVSRIDKRHSSVISLLIREVLPDILRDFPQVTLNIIGDGKYLSHLKREAEYLNKLNKREVCKIFGYLPEVKHVIRKSGVVLGVGRAAIEALSCSVPVIPLNQKFMGRFVTEQNFYLYQLNNFVAITHDPPDPKLLAELLKSYLINPEHYQEEARNLQQLVKETLSIKKISDEILGLYNHAAESKIPALQF